MEDSYKKILPDELLAKIEKKHEDLVLINIYDIKKITEILIKKGVVYGYKVEANEVERNAILEGRYDTFYNRCNVIQISTEEMKWDSYPCLYWRLDEEGNFGFLFTMRIKDQAATHACLNDDGDAWVLERRQLAISSMMKRLLDQMTDPNHLPAIY